MHHSGARTEQLRADGMSRGNLHKLAGHVLHITERCHRKQFLLKFARDRRAWLKWLFEA